MRLMQHHGFDWEGIQTALERNKDEGKVVAGGSTISQQLVKNLFLYNKSLLQRARSCGNIDDGTHVVKAAYFRGLS